MKLITMLVVAAFATACNVEPVLVSWEHPRHYVDGRELHRSDISHYELRWGANKDALTNTKTVDSPVDGLVLWLVPGTYYFTVKAVTIYGTQSDNSNLVIKGVRR